jgi:hypothetical protein
MKPMIIRLALASSLALGSPLVLAQTPAPAPAGDSSFDATHPRRAEVNQRLANQNQRIDNKVAEGKMTPAQGAAVRGQDHQIRQEERSMASQNGGHITKTEQKALNQQENHTSNEIKNK